MSILLGDPFNEKIDINAFKKQRVIRVFISSTFKDMKKERDELIKYTFPKLRKMCEERGVNWSEVDLRWGVTTEQSAEGKVLPICLAEIKNCLPFFIGILGDRYGWIPEITQELIQEYPWLEKHRGKSVTEIEILQGALLHTNGKENMNAFFYFRDPKFIHSIGEEEKLDYIETIEEKKLSVAEIALELEERKDKLEKLKDQIRDSDYYVRENFSDAKDLGNMVYADMAELIDQIFPKNVHEDEVERRANEHETYAIMKSKYFVGREEYLDQMTKHIYNENPAPLVITGDSGAGKSALLSYWALNILPKLESENIPTIMHYIGASSRDGDVSDLMRRFIMELNRKFNLDVDIPSELDELREAFAFSLDLAAEHGKVVIVLDSIDQLNIDSSETKDLFWLPTIIPSNIRLIVSTTKGNELQEFRNREWTISELKLLNETERKKIINKYLSAFGKNMEEGISKSILYHPQSNNPLFLSTLLDEIRVDGDKGLNKKVLDYVNSKNIEELFLKKIERLERDYEHERPGLVKDALSLLWAARIGLSEPEMQDLLGTDEKLSSSIWSPFFLAMESNLVKKSGYVCLFHQFLRDAVEKKYLSSQEDKIFYHKKIANYFLDNKDLSQNRVYQEVPWQWIKAKDWHELYTLFQNFTFLSDMWKYDPFMLKSYWASIEDNTKPWKHTSREELTMTKAYQDILDHPENFQIEEIKLVAKLLEDRHIDEALNIQNFIRNYFEKNGEVNNQLKTIENIANLHKMKSDYQKAMKLLKEQESIARERNMVDIIQSNLGSQADILIYWGEYNQALPLLKEQERICRFELDNKFGLQQTLGNQAKIKYFQINYEDAQALLVEKESICLATKNKGGFQEVIGLRGLIKKAENKLENALELFAVQEGINRSIGNMKDLQECLINQATTRYQLDPSNREPVIAILREQELICYNIKHRDGLQLNYGLQAKIFMDTKSFESALNMLKKQEKICRDLQNKISLQECLGRQVFILKYKNQYAKAMELLDEQEEICRRHGYLMGLQICLGNKSSIARKLGRIYEFLAYTNEQEQICKEINNKRGLFYSYGAKSWILKRFGKLDEALDYTKMQETLAIEMDFIEGYNQSLYEQANIYTSKGEYEQALLLYEKCKVNAVDEVNFKHALLKQEKINQIIENGRDSDDEELMDFHSISSIDLAIMKTIAENHNIVFEPLMTLVNNIDEINLTKQELTKILYVLKEYKALIYTTKVRKDGRIKSIYKLSDYGLERVKEIIGKVPEPIHEPVPVQSLRPDKNDQMAVNLMQLLTEVYASHQVVLNEERPIIQVNGDSSTKSIIYVNEKNIHVLSAHLEFLSTHTKEIYLVAYTELFLHSRTVIEFYQWLKNKFGKITNASGRITMSVSFMEKVESGKEDHEIWKKLIF